MNLLPGIPAENPMCWLVEMESGEDAAYGSGHYTKIGRLGARNTGMTGRYSIDPNAKAGTDFENFEIISFGKIRMH